MRSSRRSLHIPLLLGLAILTACDTGGPVRPGYDARFVNLRVMTRNLYIGGDIGPVFQADFNNPIAVIQASATVWAQIQSTDFSARVVGLADEIESRRPHLVSLQEAFRFIELDGAFQPTGELDFIALLVAELQARGLDYSLVAIQDNTQATLPLSFDPGTGSVDAYVQFTDRIAILAKQGLTVTDVTQGGYQAAYALGPISLTRGWIRATLAVGPTPVHVVNTHLEGQSLAPIQAAQLAELQSVVLAGLGGITMVMGDLNSDAEAGPGAPSWTPTYDELTSAGFVDLWEEAIRPFNAEGFTCCHDPDLRNPAPALDERIDFILMRTATRLGPLYAELVGEELDDVTPEGLWPSDHAGVVMDLGLPRHPSHR